MKSPSLARVRFNLRGMMIIVLAFGIWLGWVVHWAREQRGAVAAIERSGGRVMYDWQFTGGVVAGAVRPNAVPPAPAWLVDRLGLDFFGTAIVANLEGERGVGCLPAVSRLGRLQYLSLSMTGAGDAELANLAKLGRLEELDLGGSALGDAGLRHLEGLPRLRWIRLPVEVSDAGLESLVRMPVLRQVLLSDGCVGVSEAGLGKLARARPGLRIFR